MHNPDVLAIRLKQVGEKIARWQADVVLIRGLLNEALDTREVKASQLQQVEEIAGEIYKEIERFDVLVAEIAADSSATASELGGVGDALRLVLMEITELSTRMYSVRSREGVAPEGVAGEGVAAEI